MPSLAPVFSNLLSLVLGEVAGRLVSFLGVAYLGRTLGAEGFGTLAVAGALVSYATLGVNLGLDVYGTREVARHRDALAGPLVRIQALRALLAFACYGLLAVLALALPLSPLVRATVLVYGLVLFALAGSLAWVFQGLERMPALALATVVGQAAFAAGVWLLVRAPGDVAWAALAYVGAEATTTAVLIVFFARQPRLRGAPGTLAGWRQALREGVPLFLGKTMRTVSMNFDILALKLYLGADAAGLYSAAFRVVLFVLGVYGHYFTNLYPTLARAATGDRSSLRSLLARSVRLTAIATVPVGVGGAVLAPDIVTAVFGSDYRAAAAPFRLLILTLVVTVISGNFRHLLVASDHQGTDTRNVAYGTLLNVALNLTLIPWLGPVGAAVAFLGGDTLTLWLGRRAVRRLVRDAGMLRPVIPALAASLVMTVALLVTGGRPVPVRIVVGAAVYGVAILAMGGTSIGEVRGLVFRRRAE